MTRADVLTHLAKVRDAALAKGLRTNWTLGGPATEQQIVSLEAALGVILPPPYRESLREWDGCPIEIWGPPTSEAPRGVMHAYWFISDIRAIIASTENVRYEMNIAMAGSEVANVVGETMSRIVVIASQDDICVFFTCDERAPGDVSVRCMNLEYALGEYPPTPDVIAASPDDYLEKAFSHLASTLETEIYWW